MKNTINLLFIMVLLTVSCKKETQNPAPTAVTFTNVQSTDLTYNRTDNSITINAEIPSDGGQTIIERGVCWDTTPLPTILANKISSGSGSGIFSVNITGINLNKKYFARIFARTGSGTSYGSQFIFGDSTIHINDTIIDYGDTTGAVKDFDHNGYDTLKIGRQTWFTSDLRVKHFTNGNPLPFVNIDDTSRYKYYTWDDASVSKQVCPTGWSVPTIQDIDTLNSFLATATNRNAILTELNLTRPQFYWTSTSTSIGGLNGEGYILYVGNSSLSKTDKDKSQTHVVRCMRK